MQTALLAIGAIAAAIGLFTIGFGIEIYDFSFGNTLIIAGTTSLIGGVIIVGLATAIRELARIADALNGRLPARGGGGRETAHAGNHRGSQSRSAFAGKGQSEPGGRDQRSNEPRLSAVPSNAEIDEPPARHRQNVYQLVRPATEAGVPEDLDNIASGPRFAPRGTFLRADESDARAVDSGNGDIRAADLRSADLRAGDVTRAGDVKGAEIRGADVRGADVRAADLRAADLKAADLRAADLRAADLRTADVRTADVRTVDIRTADVRSADLRDSRAGDVRINDIKADARTRAARVSEATVQTKTNQPTSRSNAGAVAAAQVAGAQGVVLEAPRVVPVDRREADQARRANLFDALWPADAKSRTQFSKEAVARDLRPEPVMAAHQPADPNAPEERSLPRAAEEQRAVSVLKSGVIDGMAYTLYTDGSIEAQLSQNTVRFNSISELREHLESGV